MNADKVRLLQALMRNDFLSFVHRVFAELNRGRTFHQSWVHEAMCTFIGIVALEHETDRLVINVPPRSAKSTIASVALPSFLLGRDPTFRVIVVSYNQELANLFSRQTRQVMLSPWYRALFPSTVIPSRAAETAFYTSAGGYRIATSTGGTLTGKGGDLIIVDDPLKGPDAHSEAARDAALDWTRNTLFTRLDDKSRGGIIMVQQRQHEDDLSGHMLRAGGWLHLNLPAIAEVDEPILISKRPLRFHYRRAGDVLDPVREPIEVLERLKREMGSHDFAAQYQQAPVPLEGGMIKVGWFGTYDDVPDDGETVFSIDTAYKAGARNDWSVITVWRIARGRYYLLNVWRRRVEYPVLKHCVIEMAQRLRPSTILIEDKGSGTGLIQDLRIEHEGYPVVAYDPGPYDKEARVHVQSAAIEGGLVLLPPSAPWLDEFLCEVRRFPNGTHDDQIDTLAQLLAWKRDRTDDLYIGRYITGYS
ncbi:phage terminase large subunit [Tsuneonella sp. YG55]|uniref:Phage terminase large subunit n=1 Tax=Tsuneonella litorea TaxID=2976475 RepID=A0A9X3AAG1_9SPHN|nr:phage terminase large subunit [Tsuneonella litorea]MCT2559875.1 phage terminase large subunit [Tsuneonella litorea]